MHRKKPITSVVREREMAKKRRRSLPIKSRTKRAVKQALAAAGAQGQGKQAQELSRAAASALDRAAHKGVMHPRTAARKKSRLARRLKAGTRGAQSAE